MMDEVIKKDLDNIVSVQFIPWDHMRGKTFFVTGATGLIGYNLLNALLYADTIKRLGIKIWALVRSLDRANERFKLWNDKIGKTLNFVVGTIEELPPIEQNINYIIHGASETSSQAYVNQPVETILAAIYGTKNILDLAKCKRVESLVYLSSMEVYGHPEKGHKVTENEIGSLLPLNIRNSYPISKLQCENLCCAYVKEFNVPARILRLTQTFGPGVSYKDNRVFAYFERCVDEKKDIVLNTKGESERSYLYAADAVTAILTVLLKGNSGQAFNVANENTYCSIAEMAESIAKESHLNVCYPVGNGKVEEYPETIYMDLDTSLIRQLGWEIINDKKYY